MQWFGFAYQHISQDYLDYCDIPSYICLAHQQINSHLFYIVKLKVQKQTNNYIIIIINIDMSCKWCNQIEQIISCIS